MAIKPAPMDQCSKKCRCRGGVNEGLAYDCHEPCENGDVFVAELCDCYAPCTACPGGYSGSITVSQYLMKTDGSMEAQTYYLPFSPTSTDPALRVYQGNVQFYDPCAGAWVDVSPLIYTSGGDTLDTAETLTASVQDC